MMAPRENPRNFQLLDAKKTEQFVADGEHGYLLKTLLRGASETQKTALRIKATQLVQTHNTAMCKQSQLAQDEIDRTQASRLVRSAISGLATVGKEAGIIASATAVAYEGIAKESLEKLSPET